MGFLSAEHLENRIFRGNRLVLPDQVRKGIEDCLVSSYQDIEQARVYLRGIYKGDYISAPQVEYKNDAVVDAYTIEYLPRNFFAPRIAFRDLAMSRKLVMFENTIRVLDIGSGTGAVSMGIFELFSKGSLSDYSIDLLALDESESALKRQSCLLKSSRLRYKGDTFRYKPMDLSDIRKVEKVLALHGSWDIIISANFMVEIDQASQRELIALLSEHLTERGSLIILEPSQDRGKVIIHNIADILPDLGLTLYYPCSEVKSCRRRKSKCWVWRDYSIDYIKPIEREGRNITFSDKDLSMSSIIMNKCGVSLLDLFKKKNEDINWGLISPAGRSKYEICPTHRSFNSPKKYVRGGIVGWRDEDGEVEIDEYVRM